MGRMIDSVPCGSMTRGARDPCCAGDRDLLWVDEVLLEVLLRARTWEIRQSQSPMDREEHRYPTRPLRLSLTLLISFWPHLLFLTILLSFMRDWSRELFKELSSYWTTIATSCLSCVDNYKLEEDYCFLYASISCPLNWAMLESHWFYGTPRLHSFMS